MRRTFDMFSLRLDRRPNNKTHIARANAEEEGRQVSSPSESFLTSSSQPFRRRSSRRLVAPWRLSIGVIRVVERLQKSLELSLRFLDARQLSRESNPPRPISPRTQDLRVRASLSVNLLALNKKPLFELACGAGDPSSRQRSGVGSDFALPVNNAEQCRGFRGKGCGLPLLP